MLTNIVHCCVTSVTGRYCKKNLGNPTEAMRSRPAPHTPPGIPQHCTALCMPPAPVAVCSSVNQALVLVQCLELCLIRRTCERGTKQILGIFLQRTAREDRQRKIIRTGCKGSAFRQSTFVFGRSMKSQERERSTELASVTHHTRPCDRA